MNDEEIPYRSQIPSNIVEDTKPSSDEEDHRTIKSIYYNLKAALDKLNSWRAFEHKNDSELSLKQQIKVRQMAFDIINPQVELARDALMKVDATFKQRMNK